VPVPVSKGTVRVVIRLSGTDTDTDAGTEAGAEAVVGSGWAAVPDCPASK